MNTDYIFFLLGSAAISFMIGRTVMNMRKRRREAQLDAVRASENAARRNAPPEADSKNKGKRRRQLQEAAKSSGRR
jgi:hypothetical protein